MQLFLLHKLNAVLFALFSLDMFVDNEIDIATFSSLTEKDLIDIGITAWGARRRILLQIAGRSKDFLLIFSIFRQFFILSIQLYKNLEKNRFHVHEK